MNRHDLHDFFANTLLRNATLAKSVPKLRFEPAFLLLPCSSYNFFYKHDLRNFEVDQGQMKDTVRIWQCTATNVYTAARGSAVYRDNAFPIVILVIRFAKLIVRGANPIILACGLTTGGHRRAPFFAKAFSICLHQPRICLMETIPYSPISLIWTFVLIITCWMVIVPSIIWTIFIAKNTVVTSKRITWK